MLHWQAGCECFARATHVHTQDSPHKPSTVLMSRVPWQLLQRRPPLVLSSTQPVSVQPRGQVGQPCSALVDTATGPVRGCR